MLVMNSIVSGLYSNIWKWQKRRRPIQKSWLDQEQNKDWLAEASEDSNAKCKLCKKVFKLLNMATDALKCYADSEHQKK